VKRVKHVKKRTLLPVRRCTTLAFKLQVVAATEILANEINYAPRAHGGLQLQSRADRRLRHVFICIATPNTRL
jgi:hypothetical protein